MASFITHGLLGGSMMSLLAKKKPYKWFWTILGGVFGAMPDVWPWVKYEFWGGDRWALYNQYHLGWTWWDLMPPFLLHVISDIPFHPYPGFDWWPSMVWLEAIYILIACIVFWISWRFFVTET